ncbi:tubby-like F-box protein 10 [Neltuma alba]|uniref:tubby-like F-box protein 10 n=1 Tax=Neltuma alba TaxID=207710 RepID=UPI0010A3987F|nr:tubby-like F-box protein 10 [Prosopis alba]
MSLLRNGVLDDDKEQSGRWENLPPELLWDIIRRLEETETCWPERVILSCASVCKSWRAITKDIVKTPELSGRLIFPTSLKQPGPRDSPIQCYIKRKRETSIYLLYLGSEPSENKNDKLLLAAKRKQRIRNTKYVISLVADDFRRTSKTYVGKLRANFLDYKFTIYDTQPPHSNNNSQLNHKLSRCKYYNVGSITYKINMIHKCRVHRTKGPRKMSCSIMMMMKNSMTMELKSKDPIWDEQCQHWHLNFRHHDTLASDNFQLVSAADDEEHEHEQEQEEKVILEFAKIGEDVFVMDYCYPLSAFQAFAICLSNFDAKPTCD